jgi:Tfp pilus assembly protein PilX
MIDTVNTKQRGSILVISVIMLAILAGLSVAVLSNSVNEKIISANDQDQGIAQASADSAANEVKQLISDQWVVGTALCTTPPCSCTSPSPCVWASTVFTGMITDFTQQPATWWNQYASSLTAQNPALASGPQYIIVSLGCDAISSAYNFRIVTRAVGTSKNTVAFSNTLLSMPLSDQNAFSSAGAVTVRGTVIQTGQPTESVSYQMSPSSTTSRQGGFFQTGTYQGCGTIRPPPSYASTAECEMNCAGLIRVMAWTLDTGCVSVYGPWDSRESTLNLLYHGVNFSISCAK